MLTATSASRRRRGARAPPAEAVVIARQRPARLAGEKRAGRPPPRRRCSSRTSSTHCSPAPPLQSAAMESRQIEVSTLAVRRALARSFVGADPGDHAWRGRVEGDAEVVVDVRTLPDGRPYVAVSAEVLADAGDT